MDEGYSDSVQHHGQHPSIQIHRIMMNTNHCLFGQSERSQDLMILRSNLSVLDEEYSDNVQHHGRHPSIQSHHIVTNTTPFQPKQLQWLYYMAHVDKEYWALRNLHNRIHLFVSRTIIHLFFRRYPYQEEP